jgi:hypothetical protein
LDQTAYVAAANLFINEMLPWLQSVVSKSSESADQKQVELDLQFVVCIEAQFLFGFLELIAKYSPDKRINLILRDFHTLASVDTEFHDALLKYLIQVSYKHIYNFIL